jgi:alpha-galactosidase
MQLFNNAHFFLETSASGLFDYVLPNGERIRISAPAFEINGQEVLALVENWQISNEPHPLPNGCTEQTWFGSISGQTGLTLFLTLRAAADSPILRFRYTLRSNTGHRLTKRGGQDNLTYLSFRAGEPAAIRAKEIQFSRYANMLHSYVLAESELSALAFATSQAVMGPMVIITSPVERRTSFAVENYEPVETSLLLAYEHGSQVPDAFLQYHLAPNGGVSLKATRGNYWHGQPLSESFTTLWLQIGAIYGSEDDLARHYRHFILQRFATHNASRQPFIFYNTWNYQERLRHAKGGNYLDQFDTPRMLTEIDSANEMGIEVFVMDTGWYEKTGDWQVSPERFPHGLEAIKARLDQYNMKLGLWFNPTAAALSSEMAHTHTDCLKTLHGQPYAPGKVWLTEESQPHCLVSRYGTDFSDRLIALNRELGVTYFKWDGVETYAWENGQRIACDAPGHGHGDETISPAERAECAAFRFPLAMAAMVERIQAACPDAIVDFDVTEAGRAVGLAFLSAGKYFLINNGPYYHDFNMPYPPDGNWNMLFYPGPARPWFCRSVLGYDKWIPSVLLLTHFFPDDPQDSQLVNIGTLILGGNGIWGDLPAVSAEGRARIGGLLAAYKQVRGDVTAAALKRFGPVSSTPEIYEKINPENGQGVVVIFSAFPGETHHITSIPVAGTFIASENTAIKHLPDGRAEMAFTLKNGSSCGIVFFGTAAP